MQENRLSVLLATRDPAFQDRVLSIIDNYGFSVVVESSCKKVMEQLTTHRFDVAIIDPDLEELHGLDTLQLIRISRPKLPIIVASDDLSYESGVKVAKAGVFFSLGKLVEEEIIEQLFKFLKNRN